MAHTRILSPLEERVLNDYVANRGLAKKDLHIAKQAIHITRSNLKTLQSQMRLVLAAHRMAKAQADIYRAEKKTGKIKLETENK